ncbi:MAG: heat-inducible transcription repressor HrcA [Ignavibacteriales bacterium]|nr:MAG: heat-inducible transcription repressor HrcA [Ignavibacteriales bacterium]
MRFSPLKKRQFCYICTVKIKNFVNRDQLNDREQSILRYIVQQFILTAVPVGSRNITKRYDIGYSPATVRNIMSDLEESGFIGHPHTSAGRVPTDKGYRFYVDLLMNRDEIDDLARRTINSSLEKVKNEPEELLTTVSRILSSITNQLACVVYPKLDTGVLEKIQLVKITSSRIMAVITIKLGLVKTITLEVSGEIKDEQLAVIQSLLNERLAGLSLAEIRSTFRERMRDVPQQESEIYTVFFDSVDRIFSDGVQGDKIYISGTRHLIRQPEFESPEKIQNVVDLIEDKDILLHVFEKSNEGSGDQVIVSIGKENELPRLDDYSLVTKEYLIGDVKGRLGIIGPKRMEYAKIVAMVDYISLVLTDSLKKT